MKAFLFALPLLFPISPSTSAREVPAGLKEFQSESCGIRFTMPSSWIVAENVDEDSEWLEIPSAELCTVGLKPKSWDKERNASKFTLPHHAVTVTVLHRGMRKAARSAGFAPVQVVRDATGLPDWHSELSADDWTMSIRQGDTPAEWIVTKCCRGIRADGFTHDWSPIDNSVRSVSPRVVLLNNKRGTSVLITSENRYEVVDKITESLEITEAASKYIRR